MIDVPISAKMARQMARFRSQIEEAGLSIEEIDEKSWRVQAAGGRELMYFPIEDRWRDGARWGRGVVSLIRELGGRS